jgi:Polyketide cyclase / dehydrase and lipid transport
MGRWSFARTAHSVASVEDVWPLIGEAARWKEWSFLDRSLLERDGRPDPNGVGALRHFTRLGIGSTEEVVKWEPPTHLAYAIVKGFPVKDYRADVVLTSAAEAGGRPGDPGTTLTWSVTFDAKYPGTGTVMRSVLGVIVGRFARQVCRYADRQAAGDVRGSGQ